MSLPYIYAGACIVFVLICLAAYANDKKTKKQQVAAQMHRVQSQPMKYHIEEDDRNLLIGRLQAKNYSRLIAYLIDDAMPYSSFGVTQIVRTFNLTYSHAGQIADQMECLGLISPANDGKRTWLVSRHDIPDILNKIDAANHCVIY